MVILTRSQCKWSVMPLTSWRLSMIIALALVGLCLFPLGEACDTYVDQTLQPTAFVSEYYNEPDVLRMDVTREAAGYCRDFCSQSSQELCASAILVRGTQRLLCLIAPPFTKTEFRQVTLLTVVSDASAGRLMEKDCEKVTTQQNNNGNNPASSIPTTTTKFAESTTTTLRGHPTVGNPRTTTPAATTRRTTTPHGTVGIGPTTNSPTGNPPRSINIVAILMGSMAIISIIIVVIFGTQRAKRAKLVSPVAGDEGVVNDDDHDEDDDGGITMTNVDQLTMVTQTVFVSALLPPAATSDELDSVSSSTQQPPLMAEVAVQEPSAGVSAQTIEETTETTETTTPNIALESPDTGLFRQVLLNCMGNDPGALDQVSTQVLSELSGPLGDTLLVSVLRLQKFKIASCIVNRCKARVFDTTTSQGDTPLHVISDNKNVPKDLQEKLVDLSAHHVDVQNEHGTTALMKAAQCGNLSFVGVSRTRFSISSCASKMIILILILILIIILISFGTGACLSLCILKAMLLNVYTNLCPSHPQHVARASSI
eukprot:m.252787 g.252787  ORF g.252787 m.252787 type:complete len:540 (-) comp15476_c0_seq2:84-1703(-)